MKDLNSSYESSRRQPQQSFKSDKEDVQQKSSMSRNKQIGWYEPSHPNADWSGFVPPYQSRKHFSKTPPAMRVQIKALNESGICPSEGTSTLEWTKPRLKVDFNSMKHSEQGKTSNNERNDQEKSSSFSLIGGPTPSIDPSSVGSIGWETEAQSAMKQTGTRVRQLTTYGRSIHIRSKKQTTPAFELAGIGFDESQNVAIRRENPYILLQKNNTKTMNLAQNQSKTNFSGCDGMGYRSHQGGVAKSFLAGLGKQIMDKVNGKALMPVAPFATESNLPTDPYMNALGERRKDLLLENYSIALPGYTGTPNFSKST